MSNTTEFEAKGNKHIDLDAVSFKPYHTIIGELVLKYADKPGMVLIDVGCGMGQLEVFLTRNNWPGQVSIADAYDTCLEASNIAPLVVQTYKLHEIDFDLPEQVGEKKFDCLVMSHVLEHIHNPSDAMGKVMSLLKPGGVAIIAVPNPARPNVLVGNIFKKHYANRGHVQAWDASHWRVFLEIALKLDVVEYKHDFVLLPAHSCFGLIETVGVALARIIPWWSFSNIAVIRAPGGQ